MISESDLQRAREVDLLSYLRVSDPGQLVRFSRNTYCTREHDSLKISNGKWHWFSRGIGGANALDYLIKVQGYSFEDAVSTILGENVYEKVPKGSVITVVEKELHLPERNRSNDIVIRYLKGRGIDPEIIRDCINKGILYESSRYHSAVFVGQDERGNPRYAAIRSTSGGYKGEAAGSNKEYAFKLGDLKAANTLHVFEAPIDLLSYLTFVKQCGGDWTKDAYLSLGGISGSKTGTGICKQLDRALKLGENLKTVSLHLDNDEPGRNATQRMVTQLKGKYEVIDGPPKFGKDVNECLQMVISQRKRGERNAR